MTTVCTDGKTMAGDTKCGGSGTFHTNVTKVFRADDGAILGSAGNAFDYGPFLDWYNDGCKSKPNVCKDFEGLILRPDGEIWCVNEIGLVFVHEAPAAIGSGVPVAYGALDAGATPEEAVRIAIKRDGATGGNVTVLSL